MKKLMDKLNLLVIAMGAAAWLTGCATDASDGERDMLSSDQQALTDDARSAVSPQPDTIFECTITGFQYFSLSTCRAACTGPCVVAGTP